MRKKAQALIIYRIFGSSFKFYYNIFTSVVLWNLTFSDTVPVVKMDSFLKGNLGTAILVLAPSAYRLTPRDSPLTQQIKQLCITSIFQVEETHALK